MRHGAHLLRLYYDSSVNSGVWDGCLRLVELLEGVPRSVVDAPGQDGSRVEGQLEGFVPHVPKGIDSGQSERNYAQDACKEPCEWYCEASSNEGAIPANGTPSPQGKCTDGDLEKSNVQVRFEYGECSPRGGRKHCAWKSTLLWGV